MTREEFQGSVHLCQNAQHTLINGKPSDRKNYISQFFGIDDRFDLIQVKAKEELQKIQEAISELDSYSYNLRMLREDFENQTFSELTKEKEELKTLGENKAKLQNSIQICMQEHAEALKYEELLPEAKKFDKVEDLIKNTKDQIASLNQKISEISSLKKQNEENEALNVSIEAYNEKLQNVLASYPDIANHAKMLDQYNNQYQNQYSLWQRWSQVKDQIEELKTYKGDFKVIEEQAVLDKIGSLKEDIAVLKSIVKACKDGLCPTCKRPYETSLLKKDQDKLSELLNSETTLKEELRQIQENNKLTNRANNLKEVVGDLLDVDGTKLSTTLKQIYDFMTVISQYNECATFLNTNKPKEIVKIEDAGEIKAQIDSLDQKLVQYYSCLNAQEKLPVAPENSSDTIAKKKDGYGKELDEIENKVLNLNNYITSTEISNAQYSRVESQIKQLEQKLERLPDLKKQEFLFQKMVDAYGNKGLRVEHLKKIMDVVIARLPYYANMLFRESDLKFSYTCDHNNITIVAERKEGKNTFTHDISSFSGGEKKRLSVALVLTLSDCVPANKKSNILILDEVDSNLDEEGLDLFVNRLLPILKQDYESIFVISHSDSVRKSTVYNNFWEVVKENHWSEIKMS